MITKTKSGRVDKEMCCPQCGGSGMWQPEDMNPCTDLWFCNRCHGWDDPVTCGPTGGMFATGHYFEPVLVSRCAWLEAAL